MAGFRSRTGVLAAGLVAATMLAPTSGAAQEVFQFAVAARDAQGHVVTDLKREEVVMSEAGVANDIVKIEPFHVPVKLTIAVDNGLLSRDSLAHYRTGLEGLVKALPPDVEVSVIAMAPQPRTVQQFTNDQTKIIKAVNAIAPEQATPRFIDTIVEYSKRLQDEYKKTKKADTLPVLVIVSTTSPQNSGYQATDLAAAVTFLEQRKTRTFVTMLEISQGRSNTGDQPAVAIPLANKTRGRYESLNISSRLSTVLPEFGADIAALHNQHYNQFLVTAARKQAGQLQDPRIELTRPNVNGIVSVDGLP